MNAGTGGDAATATVMKILGRHDLGSSVGQLLALGELAQAIREASAAGFIAALEAVAGGVTVAVVEIRVDESTQDDRSEFENADRRFYGHV